MHGRYLTLQYVFSKKEMGKKYLASTSSLCPTLEYGSACWDLSRGQINALDPEQQKAAQFTNHTKDCDWETLAQRRTVARLCALLKRTLWNGLGKLYVAG